VSWLEGLYLVVSLALGAGMFAVSGDAPFRARLGGAALVVVFWLPALILFALMMAIDGIVALIRRARGA
jgi:hypothetical protein